MQNYKKNDSLNGTKTKAIQCEVLSNHPVSSSNSWKFITPHRLQKAIQEAKRDLGYMLSKSVDVNYPSRMSRSHAEMAARDAVLTLHNPFQEQIRNSLKAEPVIQKPKSHKPCYKDVPFNEQKSGLGPKLCVSHNSSLRTSTSSLQMKQTQYNEELTEEDLKWFRKKGIAHLNRRPVSNYTNPKSHISEKCSLLPVVSTVTPKNQNKLHETALVFINRVQMREQQLWKQLAEISVSSSSSGSSSRSSLVMGNYEPILPNLPKEEHVVTEFSGRRNSTETTKFHDSVLQSRETLADAESLISLLGEEWLTNLLRKELEISIEG